jgi:PPM family protein phosphatase
VQLSTDDSPPPLLEDPSGPVAVVTQTLGGTPEPVAISPHVHSMKVAPGDRFLLCSDGLTDCVPLDDIEQRLAGAGDDLVQVRALLDAAMNAGGPDNISIVLITVQE